MHLIAKLPVIRIELSQVQTDIVRNDWFEVPE